MTVIILFIVYNIYTGNIIGSATYITLMLAVDRLGEYMYELFGLVKSGNRLGLYTNNIRNFYNMDSGIEKQTYLCSSQGESPMAFLKSE